MKPAFKMNAFPTLNSREGTSSKDLKVRVGTTTAFVPAGDYKAKVKDITKRNSSFGNNKPIFEFLFEICEGEYRGAQVRGFCNAVYESFSSNTKLFKWFAIIAGEDPEPDEEMDLEAFYGKVFKVRIVEKVSKKTKNRFGNVEEILEVVLEL